MAPHLDILYVITKATWGGAQRYVYDLALAMHKEGRTVAVAYGTPGLLIDRLSALGIRTIPIPALGRDVRIGKDLEAYRALITLFKDERPRVVHLNSSKAGFVGALAAKKVGIKKSIFTAHGWAFTEPRNVFSRKLFAWIQKKTVMLTDTTIAVSDFILNQTNDWHLPEGKIERIYHGIPEATYLSKDAARAALIAIDPTLGEVREQPWVGTIAELHTNKGIDIGIRAWKKMPETNAAWIVLGEGEQRALLEQLRADDSRIHLLGFVPDAATYLKAFDLFLLPSRTEALGYVLLEAGLAGVPVLTNGRGGTGEIASPEYSPMGYFKPEDPESLSTMLSTALDDNQNLSLVGENLSRYIKQKFSITEMIKKTKEIYDR